MSCCGKCGKPLSQKYAQEWTICRVCRGVNEDDLPIPDIATPEEIATQKEYVEVKPSGSIWIAGMQIFAWIAFCGIIIGGTILAFQVGNFGIGVLIFVGSVIVAFLTVALLMIFLDLAKDISDIKRYLVNDDKKQAL